VTRDALVGNVLYGSLFALVVPALLFLWARATSDVVLLPAVHSPPIGAARVAMGCGLTLWPCTGSGSTAAACR
jgi:hypothetical protein